MLAAQLDAPARAPGREVDRLVRRLFDDGQAEAADELAALVPGIVEGVVQLVAVVATGAGEGVRPFRPGEFSALAALSAAPAGRACLHRILRVERLRAGRRCTTDGAECPLLAEIERAVAPA